MKIHFFARDVNVKESFFDEKLGKMVEHTYNPMQQVQKMGVKCLAMPEDLVLYERKVKGEPKPVFMHERGCLALAPFENGQILTSYHGNHLNRAQFLSMDQVKQLCGIFNGTNVSKS